jgi:hypothetical protein
MICPVDVLSIGRRGRRRAGRKAIGPSQLGERQGKNTRGCILGGPSKEIFARREDFIAHPREGIAGV